MAYRRVRSETAVLTPAHVEQAQAAASIPGERPIRPKRANTIRQWIANGRFCRANFAYAKCKEDGVTYRVNGQHTSHELSKCDDDDPNALDFPQDVEVHIEHWECDNLGDLADIFDTFDNPTSARSNDDKLGVFLAQYDDLRGVSKTVTKAAVQAVNEYRRGLMSDECRPVHSRELGLLLADDEIREFVRFCADFEESVYRGWKNYGIGAAMYETWKEDAETAREIWSEVFEESNPDPRSPMRLWVSQMRASEARSGKDKRWYYRSARREYKKWCRQTDSVMA